MTAKSRKFHQLYFVQLTFLDQQLVKPFGLLRQMTSWRLIILGMNSTIEFYDLHKMNQQLLNNSELFNRPARNKSLRLNLKQLSSLSNIDTKAPTTMRFITPTPREQSIKKLQSPRENLNATMDLSLPKLSRTSEKSNRKIDRTYLQQWLNEALEEDDGSKGPLRGVRKYMVDKRHLLGQNISQQAIDKLYQSLYMYSHGLRRVLGDILNYNEEMIIKFWRVFLKLVEQTSEFDNLFSVIDRKHTLLIDDLKKLVAKREQQLQVIKEEYEEKMKDISRDLNSKTEEIKSLKLERYVLENNFELTNQAFNEEVGLRLRFEEKINAINTAYTELKMKYGRLIEELQYHREGTLTHSERQRQHVDEKCSFETALLEKYNLIEVEKSKNHLKEEEIEVLRQEILDLNQKRLDIIKHQDQEEVEMKNVLNRQKNATLRLAEELDSRTAANILFLEKTKEIEKLTLELQKQKKNYEEACTDCYELRKSAHQLQKQIEDLQNSTMVLDRRVINAEGSEKYAKQTASKLSQKNESLQRESQFLKRKCALIEEGVTATQKTIQSLRQAKQKYQKMYKIIENQQNTTAQILNEANNKIAALQEEKKGFIIMIQQKSHLASQSDIRLKTDLDIVRHKVESMDIQIKQKDINFLRTAEKFQKARGQISQKSLIIDRLQKNIFELSNLLSKETFQKKNLESKCKLLDESVDSLKLEVQKLNNTIISLRRNNTSLNNTKTTLSHILDEKKKFTETENETTKGFLRIYKQELEEKAQYIHPMHYWDKQAFANRCQQTVDPLLEKTKRLQELVEKKSNNINETQQQVLRIKKQYSEILNKVEFIEAELSINKNVLDKRMEEINGKNDLIGQLEVQIKEKNQALLEATKKIQIYQRLAEQISQKKQGQKNYQTQTVHHIISLAIQTEFAEKEFIQSSRQSQRGDFGQHEKKDFHPKTPRDRQPVSQAPKTPRKQSATPRNYANPTTPPKTPNTFRTSRFEQAEADFFRDEQMITIQEAVGGEQSPRKVSLADEGSPLESVYSLDPQPVREQAPPGPAKSQKPPLSMKPVSNKEFSKALKFTFMKK